MDEAKKAFKFHENIKFCDRASEALTDAEALLLITEWTEFRALDFSDLKLKPIHVKTIDFFGGCGPHDLQDFFDEFWEHFADLLGGFF